MKIPGVNALRLWDNWLPLGTIAVFGVAAVPVATGAFDFGLDQPNADRLQVIYTDIGIQTTAGIFAIVISLSLVAIQFAAQEYSHRIMEYYLRSTIFWSTFAVYIGLIAVAVLLQVSSSEADSEAVASLVVLGSLLALVLLTPHFLITAAYLKPDFIITKLMGRLDNAYFDRVARIDGAPGPGNDRLLPVVEIVERAIDRGDVTTSGRAMDEFLNLYRGIATPSPAVSSYFVDHLARIGRKAVSQADEGEAAVRVVSTIGEIGRDTGSGHALRSLDALVFTALRHGSEAPIEQGIDALHSMFDACGPEDRDVVIEVYAALVRRLSISGYEQLLDRLVERLADISRVEASSGDSARAARAAAVMESIAAEAAEARLARVVTKTIVQLTALGRDLAEVSPATAREIGAGLLRVERSVPRNDRETLASLAFGREEIERAVPLAPNTSAPPTAPS
ncbi:MAG: hypothetical protein O3C10_03600, partial [Chloroflexi bacterium]|nr:hypothetical protein [Chloroflexota bacterium]